MKEIKEKKQMTDILKVEGIKPKQTEKPIQVYLEEGIINSFKATCKRNKHTIKEAIEFGIRAYKTKYGQVKR